MCWTALPHLHQFLRFRFFARGSLVVRVVRIVVAISFLVLHRKWTMIGPSWIGNKYSNRRY